MFVDSHCHLYKEYYEDIKKVIDDATKKGVNYYITNGVDTKSNKEVLETISKYKEVYGAIGIHPENMEGYTKKDIEFIANNLNNKKIVAIGEIGLDYHYTKDNKESQKELFQTLLKLAEEKRVPVIIHSRDATEDTLNILKNYHVTGLIHSFSGSLETAIQYIKMGFLIGVNGVITFKNAHIKEVIAKIPLENIVLETDSPFLTPHPYRGTQNNPGYIKEIAEFVSELKNISLEELSKITNNNLQRIFNLKGRE